MSTVITPEPPMWDTRMPNLLGGDHHTTNMRLSGTGITSAVWPAANRALFWPFRLPAETIARRLWYMVGATGGTDNIDLGIYTQGGALIVSTGGVLVGTAANYIALNITDTTLAPGSYYMAAVMNGITATARGWVIGLSFWRTVGVLQMATAYPLPATATFAAVAGTLVPRTGICTTATP